VTDKRTDGWTERITTPKTARASVEMAVYGQPGTKCLISSMFVKTVIKLLAELMRTVQPEFAVYKQDTETVTERE